VIKPMGRNLLAAAVLLAPAWNAGAALAAAEPPSRPNILFLFADDWAWPHASCLGDRVIKTPTFDRLVRQGVMFRNAHCAAPSCSPSRAAVLTGQWPWRLEQGANLKGYLPAKFAVYPDLLEHAGYYVGLTGKGYGPGSLGDRKRNAAGPLYKNFTDFLAQRPAGQPFCYWFGSHHPHRPYAPGCGAAHGLDPSAVQVPPYLPDCPAVRSDICDYYYNTQVFDQEECAPILAALERTGEMDNTLIVISGDNGWPFPRSKATNFDTGTHQTLAICWPAKIKGGRTVDDFVSLADLAPTFLQAAGLAIPPTMTARSLLPILLAEQSGQIDPQRDHVLTGMETHVACHPIETGDNGELAGYPRRTIVTRDFHYVRNFHPERWPGGAPEGLEKPGAQPFTFERLASDTFTALADIDASPSKAWLLLHRNEPAVQPLAAAVMDKRPARELYDLHKDPYELTNVAEDPAYARKVQELDGQLMAELKATGDPRACNDDPDRFDHYGVQRSARRQGK